MDFHVVEPPALLVTLISIPAMLAEAVVAVSVQLCENIVTPEKCTILIVTSPAVI